MISRKKAVFLSLCLGGMLQATYVQAGDPLSDAIARDHLTRVMSVAQSAKLAVAETYAAEGRLPNSNQQAWLNPVDYSDVALSSVAVGSGGVVTATFNGLTGVEAGRVIFTPAITPSGLRWQCLTTNYPEIELTVLGCVYQNDAAFDSLRQGVLTASSVKMQVAEAYADSGVLPDSNAASGLPVPEAYAQGALQSVAVSHGGKVTLQFAAQASGLMQGSIILIPEAVNGSIRQWRCVSPDYLYIGQALSSCEHQDPIVNGMLKKQNVQNGFASSLISAASVKATLQEFYVSEGVFPGSNAAAWLPAPESYATDFLKSISVSAGGVITLRFTALSGVQDGTLLLTPVTSGWGAVSWECTTKSYPDIAAFISACRYQP